MSIVEWIENVKLGCELCAMDRVEHLMLLRLRGGALAVYQQLSKEKRTDPDGIFSAIISSCSNMLFFFCFL